MAAGDEDSDFVSQGGFNADEVEKVLARLKSAGVRFEIEVYDAVRPPAGFTRGRPRQKKVRLYVHKSDEEAWLAIRNKLYPV